MHAYKCLFSCRKCMHRVLKKWTRMKPLWSKGYEQNLISCVPHQFVLAFAQQAAYLSLFFACTDLETVWAMCKGWSTLHSPGILKLGIIVSDSCELVWLFFSLLQTSQDETAWLLQNLREQVEVVLVCVSGPRMRVCVSRRLRWTCRNTCWYTHIHIVKQILLSASWFTCCTHTPHAPCSLVHFTVWYSLSVLCKYTKQYMSVVASLLFRLPLQRECGSQPSSQTPSPAWVW